jgi:radical SAM protein with 4Fe4S-binding SPASM domain
MALINFSRLFDTLGRLHSFLPARLGLDRAFPPLFVQIEVTHRCNAGCPMCYQNDKLGTDDQLTLEEIKGVVDQVPPWAVLSLTGGEPFTREDFASILEYCLNKRKCTILTNGSLVADSHIEMMVRNGLTLMAVSIDGVGETHDGIRKIPGLFDRAVATIEKIQQKKRALNSHFPLIDIKTVILKENLHQLSDILAVADRLSADFITYSIPRSMDNLYSPPYRDDLAEICRSQPSCPALSADDLDLLKKQIAEIRRYSGKTRIRFYPANMLDERVLEKFYRQELSRDDFQECLLPWSRLSISPHGDVYPCLSYRVGNVRSESLARIWNGARFRSFRKSLDRERLSGFCLTCCNSVCRHRER